MTYLDKISKRYNIMNDEVKRIYREYPNNYMQKIQKISDRGEYPKYLSMRQRAGNTAVE